jgi:hypothetical protein
MLTLFLPKHAPHAEPQTPRRMPTGWHYHSDEVGSDALEDNRDTPREATLCVVCLATPRAGTPLIFSPLPLLQALIVATIQVDIDESFVKQNKKRISRWQSGLITSAVTTQVPDLLARPSRAARHHPLHEHLTPRSACRCDSTPKLMGEGEGSRRSKATGEWVPTRM